MEKLDKVIAGLECCRNKSQDACLAMCPYYGERDGEKVCLDLMQEDALRILKMWDVIHKDIWDRTHEVVRLKKELKAVRAELDVARKHSEDLMEKLCRSCGNGDYVHEYEMYVCRCGGDCQWVPMEVDNG